MNSLLRIAILCIMAAATAALIVVALSVSMSMQRSRQAFPIMFISLVVFGSAGSFLILIQTIDYRRRATMFLHHLEQAVRLNLPLPRIIQSIGESEGGRFGREMQQARLALEQGAPLGAVVAGVPGIPQRIAAMIAAAERVGRLPSVLARLIQQRREAMTDNRLSISLYRIYPLLVGTAVFVVGTLLMIFVVPKFEVILRDFNVKMPWITGVTLDFVRHFGGLITLLAVAAVIGSFLLAMAEGWRGAGMELIGAPANWIGNRLPWIGAMRRDHSLGEALEFTADAVEAGRSLPESIREAAQISTNTRLVEQLNHWIAGLNAGESASHAARGARLPPLVCGMLATAVETSDFVPVLQFLARYYSARFSRSAVLLRAAAVPAMAITMGIVVGWVALAMFVPMVRMIERVVPETVGLR